MSAHHQKYKKDDNSTLVPHKNSSGNQKSILVPAQNPSNKTNAKLKGNYYHLFNNVVENRKLFVDNKDYQTFIKFLKEYLSPPPDPSKVKKTFSVNGRTFKGIPHQPKNYHQKVELLAYGLLPNHFHLLVNEIEKNSLERLIRSLCTRYAIYYNNKYHHHGSIFSGPYKSKALEDISKLALLSRYLHYEHLQNNSPQESSYSSYAHYLQAKNESWIKPEVVIAHLENSGNSFVKGKLGYQNYVEKYQLSPKEAEILAQIKLDTDQTHSVKIRQETINDLPINPQNIDPSQIQDVRSSGQIHQLTPPATETNLNFPEFITTATIVFIILLGLGIRNVTASLKSTTVATIPETTTVSQVSGAKTETILQEDTNSNADNRPPAKVVKIINDPDVLVNIRQEPTTNSEILQKAQNGTNYEYVSYADNWYQIKLDDGSPAFVYYLYAEIQQNSEGDNNQ